MLFNSFEFLFIFLPSVFLLARAACLLGQRSLYIWVIGLSSLVFYSVWEIKFLPILLISISANFLLGVLINRSTSCKKPLFIFAIIFNLLAISYYKYTNLFFEMVELVLSIKMPAHDIALPNW